MLLLFVLGWVEYRRLEYWIEFTTEFFDGNKRPNLDASHCRYSTPKHTYARIQRSMIILYLHSGSKMQSQSQSLFFINLITHYDVIVVKITLLFPSSEDEVATATTHNVKIMFNSVGEHFFSLNINCCSPTQLYLGPKKKKIRGVGKKSTPIKYVHVHGRHVNGGDIKTLVGQWNLEKSAPNQNCRKVRVATKFMCVCCGTFNISSWNVIESVVRHRMTRR